MARTRNLSDVIKAKKAADPEFATAVDQEAVNAHIAQKVYDLRTSANLSQKALADLIGTQQSVISRIEDADYEGHSLGLLKRIAEVLGKKLVIDFTDPEPRPEIKPCTADWATGLQLFGGGTPTIPTLPPESPAG